MNTRGIRKAYIDIKRRCCDEKYVAYKDYGGKGIKICEEWNDYEIFKKWALENGYNENKRLRRIDTSKGYYPENCEYRDNEYKGTKKRIREARARREQIIKDSGVPKDYLKHPIYSAYMAMKARCNYPNHPKYKNYGARGIKVCDEWNQKYGFYFFYKWSMKNGWEKGLSIDRIDNNGNYDPSNCRWTDMMTQANNKRNTILYDYNGNKVCSRDISILENVDCKLLRKELSKGLSVEEALSKIKIK